MATDRIQFTLGRLTLAVESARAGILDVFRRMYGVATAVAPRESVPDIVFQLRPAGRGRYRWVIDGQPAVEACDPSLVLAHFEWAMHDALAVALLPAVTVHAAVATNAAGDGVALVGVSGSGKSTLAAGLVASGWTLFADEFFVIEPGGVFVPMPGLIALKGAAIDLIRQRSRDLVFSPVASDPGRGPIAHLATTRAASRDASLHLRAVVFPRFQETGPTVAMTPLSVSDAFFRVADQSHNYHLLGARAFHDLVSLARTSAYAMDFADLDAGLDAVRSVVAQ